MIASNSRYTSLPTATIDNKRFIALENKSTQTVRHAIFPQQERDLDAAIVLESKRILNETQSDQYTTVSLSEFRNVKSRIRNETIEL